MVVANQSEEADGDTKYLRKKDGGQDERPNDLRYQKFEPVTEASNLGCLLLPIQKHEPP